VSALGGPGAVEQVGFASRVAKLIEAVRLRDGEGFVRMATFLDNYKDAQARGDSIAAGNWGQIVGQAWNMDGALASLSDLVGASTLNRAAGYQNGYAGHSDQYYRNTPGFGANTGPLPTSPRWPGTRTRTGGQSPVSWRRTWPPRSGESSNPDHDPET